MKRIAVIGSKAAFDGFVREALVKHPDAIYSRAGASLAVGEQHFLFAGRVEHCRAA